MLKCPGMDKRYWKPEDIFDVRCPACERPVEFFKTDAERQCNNCGYTFKNPRLDPGCAAWCPHAAECAAVPEYVRSQIAKAGRQA